MTVELKKGTLDDLVKVQTLNRAIFIASWNPPYSIIDYLAKLRETSSLLLLAVNNQEAVGDLIAITKKDTFYIWLLAVKEKFRKQGIGNALIDYCEKFAKNEGYSSLTTKVYNVSREMQRILIKRGYIITGFHSECNPYYNSVHFELPVNLSRTQSFKQASF